MKTLLFKKLTLLIAISGLCTLSSASFSDVKINANNPFENRINYNFESSPMTRQTASIQFVSPKSTSDLALWAELWPIDILSLSGKVDIGGEVKHITLADTGAYDAPIDQVIRTQLTVYFRQHLELSIARKEEQLTQLHSMEDRAAIVAEIKDLKAIQSDIFDSITWISSAVIVTNAQLYKLTSDLSHQYRVYLPKKNNAAIYDEYWIQPGKEKRSLQSIKALLLEDAGFRMQFSTSPTKSALNKSSSRGIASLCGPEANVPGESFCPPDNTYEPELPSWYGIFVQESPGPVYYVHGLAHTTVKWGTTKSLDAFKNTVLPSCSPRVSTDGAAKCRNGLWQFQSDVIYVPDSTYEAETIIPNPACLHRTGIPSVDGPNGCFVPYLAYGDFPGGYLDTTLLDSPGTYNAATGAAYAQSLVQGINYEEYIYFHANKQPLAELDYRTVYALGQIGSRIGCSSTLCIFATDTTRRLAEEIIIPTQ